jgi:pimeloyl-ACP methyl ester carboxylesterase
LPRAQLAVIAEAAHAVFFDQPDDFNQRLDDFVAHIDAGVGEAAH